MKATKECHSCGAPNDLLFSNCVFCKAPLPLDENSLTNEELIMNASDWISKSTLQLLAIKGPNANQFTGKDIKIM